MQKSDLIIKSKIRVNKFGEVNTNKYIVNEMLSLLENEATNIESRFLEPACGDGNFLSVIFQRKILFLKQKKSPQNKFEKNSILAASSLYGIDLILDNVQDSIERLTNIFSDIYSKLYKNKCNHKIISIIRYIFSLNIVRGDALHMKTLDGNNIVFPEWSFINSTMVKRRDFEYEEIVKTSLVDEIELIGNLSNENFIAKPIKDYKPIHYLSIDAL